LAGLTSSEAKWYIGELIEEITVEGEPRNVVHREVKILYANSPEEAYGQAQALGKEAETDHLDPERKLVRTRFWGLAELNVVHDDAKNGAALFYHENIGVPGEKTHHWILPKINLIASYPKEAMPTVSFSFKPNSSKPVSPG
jgi:hypothetical protein